MKARRHITVRGEWLEAPKWLNPQIQWKICIRPLELSPAGKSVHAIPASPLRLPPSKSVLLPGPPSDVDVEARASLDWRGSSRYERACRSPSTSRAPNEGSARRLLHAIHQC